jgi:hypothetical protein
MKLFLLGLLLFSQASWEPKAQLYTSEDGKAYALKNEGRTTWHQVLVKVNGGFRLAVEKVPPGQSINFEPAQLTGADGGVPPAAYKVKTLELVTEDFRLKVL